MNSPASQVEEKGLRMLNEFRAFAMKGNVIDLAVGIIIGARTSRNLPCAATWSISPLA